jgi:hypothetical protein
MSLLRRVPQGRAGGDDEPVDFEDWIRAQLRPGAAPAGATGSSRRVQAFAWRRRGRFLQGLMAGAALTFLFLGASSSGSVQSLKLRVLPVEPQALPVTLLAGAPTVPDAESTAPGSLAAGHDGAAGPSSPSHGGVPAAVPFDASRDEGGPGHLPAPAAIGTPEPEQSPDSGHSPDGGISPGGAPSPGPSPDGHHSDSGQPPGR